MPPKEKKPRKKVTKKPKQPKQRQKQRQNVNVNVKIDNSKKTNPRQPNATKTNVNRLPTGGSSTPLNTIIMPATASPSVLQREPNYAETINDLFKDAEMKQNKQLTLLGSNLESNQNRLLNQLSLTNKPYNPSQMYDALQEEHRVRNISFNPPDNFEDKNQSVINGLNINIRDVESADEGDDEGEDEAKPQPQPQPEEAATSIDFLNPSPPPKRKAGRPPKYTADERAERAEQKRINDEATAELKLKERQAKAEQKRNNPKKEAKLEKEREASRSARRQAQDLRKFLKLQEADNADY